MKKSEWKDWKNHKCIASQRCYVCWDTPEDINWDDDVEMELGNGAIIYGCASNYCWASSEKKSRGYNNSIIKYRKLTEEEIAVRKFMRL